jgi:hypothetical protein
MRRLAAPAVLAVLAGALAACSGHAPVTGTVAGVAHAVCPPPAPARRLLLPPEAASRRLVVYVLRGHRTVATQVLRPPGQSGGRYRLTLLPGRYRLVVPLSGSQARFVTVRAGATVTENFLHTCLL